jgi:hypothetical protein
MILFLSKEITSSNTGMVQWGKLLLALASTVNVYRSLETHDHVFPSDDSESPANIPTAFAMVMQLHGRRNWE